MRAERSRVEVRPKDAEDLAEPGQRITSGPFYPSDRHAGLIEPLYGLYVARIGCRHRLQNGLGGADHLIDGDGHLPMQAGDQSGSLGGQGELLNVALLPFDAFPSVLELDCGKALCVHYRVLPTKVRRSTRRW